ncbi:DNA-3-methyladenine glycosylase I [Actinoplanes bogorensis]|uniref:DNA-3-methyladenine glycosylase I n=1 Tax=Paractinoplanes bogorensis TaxID=1610840 RepID=A0ABS5YI06_9ACTN|nr:DNA-3-methyladenine glycosylase I [Actinoplanes bogorensis]MBU2663040.1 DNA-3-methyladenine glycosylase I [Actinoplanes bogorensis]
MTDTSAFGAPQPGVAPADLLEAGLVVGDDGRARCFWGGSTPDYVPYHDSEWGRVVRGDDALFERMCLEAFQSGLSWITILRKRPAFRAAFAGFSIAKVAAFSDADATRLMTDAGIVRNRMKIDAALANARVAADLPDGLDALLWSYAPAPKPPRPATRADVPAITPESKAMAKDLKKRGFRFVGPTTAYALMQATGMVDDHLAGCWVPPGGADPGA